MCVWGYCECVCVCDVVWGCVALYLWAIATVRVFATGKRATRVNAGVFGRRILAALPFRFPPGPVVRVLPIEPDRLLSALGKPPTVRRLVPVRIRLLGPGRTRTVPCVRVLRHRMMSRGTVAGPTAAAAVALLLVGLLLVRMVLLAAAAAPAATTVQALRYRDRARCHRTRQMVKRLVRLMGLVMMVANTIVACDSAVADHHLRQWLLWMVVPAERILRRLVVIRMG